MQNSPLLSAQIYHFILEVSVKKIEQTFSFNVFFLSLIFYANIEDIRRMKHGIM